MKKQLKKTKLTLGKETLIRLENVTAGLMVNEPASGAPDHCWFSDCNPCDTNLQC